MTKQVDNVNQSPAATSIEIIDDIHAVRRLFRQRRHAGQQVGGRDLSHMESRVLHFLGKQPGASQAAVAVRFGRDKAQIARLVGNLRRFGLVEVTADEDDRRAQQLNLTPTGQHMHEAVEADRIRLAGRAIANFSPVELETLHRLLARVRVNLADC